MPQDMGGGSGVFGRLRDWFRSQVQDVPVEAELCEYDCRKQECTEEEFATCERRRAHVALMDRATSEPVEPETPTR
jgi:hypothetical protein